MINAVIGLIIGGLPAEPVFANDDLQVFMFFLLRTHWTYCFFLFVLMFTIHCHQLS